MQNEEVQLTSVKFKDMPTKNWYVSVYHDGWYYHTPRKSINQSSPAILESTLDEDLKPLALMLIGAGYTTHPSCAGHHHSQEHIENVYNYLLKDAKRIRSSKGLVLIDTETGEELILKNFAWQLPWKKEEFSKAMKGKTSHPEGYLGISSPDKNKYEWLLGIGRWASNHIPNCRVEIHPSMYQKQLPTIAFRIGSEDPIQHSMSWKQLSRMLHPLL
jgi:hypothetical protein